MKAGRIPVTDEMREQLADAESALGGRMAAARLLGVSDRMLLRIESGATPTVSVKFGREVAVLLRRSARIATSLAKWFEEQFPEEKP